LWTRVAKSSNQESWDWLCRFLEPKPQSHQIDISRIHFVNVWKQGIKISKSRHWFFRFLAPKLGSHEIETAETNFPTFGATARKLSNREFGGFILSDFATIRDWFLLSGGGVRRRVKNQRFWAPGPGTQNIAQIAFSSIVNTHRFDGFTFWQYGAPKYLRFWGVGENN
jgi:hypothetical protein